MRSNFVGKGACRHKLTLAGIIHRFEVVVCGDDVEDSKPNPEIFLKAASYCAVEPKDCIIIEDSPAGCKGAINAGIPYFLVPDMAKLGEDVKKKALHVCKDLLEVAYLFSS